MSVFNTKRVNHLKQPMFFGETVAVARYDQVKYPFLDRLTEKQWGFFWRETEIDVSKDSSDFNQKLTDAEKHVFVKNLQYQILLDSVQGRAPVEAFLPHCSLPELEEWLLAWSAIESIHSRSYSHIIRNVFSDPSQVFDEILSIEPILNRAKSVTEEYDKLIKSKDDKNQIFLTLASVNILEAIRFYVSFACSFSFAERKLMVGNASIIKLIARDESVHLSGTQFMLQRIMDGSEGVEWQKIADDNKDLVLKMFKDAAYQEKEWAEFLFSKGSVIGLNVKILQEYVEYITDIRIKALGYEPIFNRKENPLPWMNNWLNSSNYQVAPQEQEISSYLSGAIDSSVDVSDFGDLSL